MYHVHYERHVKSQNVRDAGVWRHLVSMEGVHDVALKQVGYFDRAVTGAADKVVVGGVEGKAIDHRTVN